MSVASMCVMRATSLMQPPVYECAGTMDCGLELPYHVVDEWLTL